MAVVLALAVPVQLQQVADLNWFSVFRSTFGYQSGRVLLLPDCRNAYGDP